MSQTEPPHLPDLCERGTVVYVGMLPPSPGGSSIVNRNLLERFSPASFVVATTANRDRHAIAYHPEFETHEILRSFRYSRRMNNWLFRVQAPSAGRKLAQIAQDVNAAVIVGSYPVKGLLEVARLAAREAEIPWIAYLHDTVAEGTSHLSDRSRLRRLQNDVFAEASHVAVMSEGMADLYTERYDGFATTPLEHTYPLEVRTDLPEPASNPKIFWAGNVYNINARSFGRVASAAKATGVPISMTTARQLADLESLGIDVSLLDRVYYPAWSDYLAALHDHEVHLLALDWPDESPIHRDELATIFPTKTPEYLASGRPILVHCPDDYFLARFFREHDCGTVVSERSIDSLVDAIGRIRTGGDDIRRMSKNGLAAMDRFRPKRVSGRLKGLVDAVSDLKWGEKLDVVSDWGTLPERET